ncbi:sensor histidine kinase [Microvirga terricola]|uniref:histidine kinase n=1 Tax=Microvirga terricola TaxID=2719797 RepID=A0ABX0VFN9_9HYPH|nr:sensor histidine kinase [Microvirga terricola]NIX77520.1 sensor histidine kinase [Microvirga terricola]
MRTEPVPADREIAIPSARWPIWAILAAIVIAFTIWFAGTLGETRAYAALEAQADTAATLDIALLRSELDKQRSLPFVLSKDPDVRDILSAPSPSAIASFNAKLEALQEGTQAAVIYLIGVDGIAIAASNWREPTSFVGNDYRFRRYFQRGLSNGGDEHYALGSVSRHPGLYISRRVDGSSGPLGVIVVKVEFDQVEAEWARSGNPAYVTDQSGIVLVTSVPEWRFMAERNIAPQDAHAIRESLQFGDASLQPLPLKADSASSRSKTLLASLPGGSNATQVLVTENAMPTTQWTFHLLTPSDKEVRSGILNTRLAALSLVTPFLAGAAFVIYRRNRAIGRAAMQEAARRELEQRVSERTEELSAANNRLIAEMDERQKVETRLQAIRDELVQANRLGSLGQIAAGVAHEINQPVAAIRTYADNARVFLERNEAEPVQRNLATIANLTERIGAITDELRSFSRKGTGEIGPVRVEDVINGALLLLGSRFKQQGILLLRDDPPPDLKVAGTRVRLEQVLVNLLQNAVEALEGQPGAEVRIGLVEDGDFVWLSVRDNGPGIPPETMTELFTPFSTTKPRGLGLGLVISNDIATEFGGHLSVESALGQGAVFTIHLRRIH